MLKELEKKYPNSTLYGIEPSSNAKKFFDEVHPKIQFFEGVFEKSPFRGNKHQLIVLNGVVEHVPHPLDFLKQIKKCLAPDGKIYIGVPNLRQNPADMFTWDHLSRFTPETLSFVFYLAGLEIVEKRVSSMRVPMWFLLKHAEHQSFVQSLNIKSSAEATKAASNLVQKTLAEIAATFASYNEALNSARQKGGKIAVYGTGSFALLGTKYTKIEPKDIEFFVDDNHTMWGSERIGFINNPQELLGNKRY